MALANGTRLGVYEILGPLGAGGMGEVYRASDGKLKREVALKVLPPEFTADHERLARFEREAQILAQLQHPHIAAIFGLEESSGIQALVMELVNGPTLAERIASGPLPLDEALSLSREIAEALEAAHEKGIVHRDLKPQNIKLAGGSVVKVLDFGLAKAMESGSTGAVGSGHSPTFMNSPTLHSVDGTRMGVILGTAGYMSPEQAKGFPIDKGTDIWAFGVVLFEILSGRTLFKGDSVGDTLAAVIRGPIDLDLLPEATPPALRRLLRRCLERNRRNRLHDIADARLVIEDLIAGKSDETAAPTGRAAPSVTARRGLLAVLFATGLLLGGSGGFLTGRAARPSAPEAGSVQFVLQPPPGRSFRHGIAISPDGRQIAFAAISTDTQASSLWVRSLDSLEARLLPGTDDARYPFWAPDSHRLGFFSQRAVKWIDIKGGTPIVVAPTSSTLDVRGGAWAADDTILFAPSFVGPLMVASAKGGSPAPAIRLPGVNGILTARFPIFLPDGKRFVFYGSPGTGIEPGFLYLGRLGTQDTKVLGPANSAAIYVAPGSLVFAQGESLVAQQFDDHSEQLVGAPIALGIASGGSISVAGMRAMSAAQSTLIYRMEGRGTTELVWLDRSGHQLSQVGEKSLAMYYAPRLSPDGKSLLVSHYTTTSHLGGEIWLHDLERNLASRLTFDGGDDYESLWLKTGGNQFLYNSVRPHGDSGIYRSATDRPGREQLWQPGTDLETPDAATPDDRIIFERNTGPAFSLWIRPLNASSPPTRLGSGNANENSADLSPDGTWLAYASDASGDWQVYVRRLDGTGAVVRVSAEGGNQPTFRRDGRELFYVDPQKHVLAAAVTATATEIQIGRPQILFVNPFDDNVDRQYDVSPDGQRFLVSRRVLDDTSPLVVLLGWKG
jgi:Tol biopolymer transport system component